MTIEKKLLGTNPVSGEVLPEAVSFDGATDKLRKASDLTGNADGKKLTFSTWFYSDENITNTPEIVRIGNFVVNLPTQGNGLHLRAYSSGGYGAGPAFYVNWVEHSIPQNQWNHLLVSIDVTGANTAKRHVYLNDVNINTSAKGLDTWDSWNDRLIEFTKSTFHFIGGVSSNTQNIKGRLAHVFLDYTYRDLSTTSNRRLFIDADGKPSSTIPSSPIIYLPMKDAATAGSNSGTGGDFTVNGVLATAERGPNQDNCVASTFDGSNDYLSISGIGAVSSKVITFNVNWRQNAHKSSEPHIIMGFAYSGTIIYITNNTLSGSFRSSSGSDVVNFEMNSPMYTYPVFKIHKSLSMCIDVDDVNKCKMFINGQVVASTFTIVNAINISIPNGIIEIGRDLSGTSQNANANMGELYFDDAYIDLATSNPFWDSDTNRPNSVRKVIADTSVTPLIALPIIGNDAGNNLGSGGDFTVHSGPYTGARGGSEFWARSIYSAGNSQFLQSTSLSAMSQFTMVAGLDMSRGGNAAIVAGNSGATYFDSEQGVVRFWNSNNEVVRFGVSTNYTSGWNTLMVSVDLSTNTAYCYINGTSIPILSNNMSSYSNADFNPLKLSFEANTSVSSFYLDDSYINFTQEANRNKFVDQLGYLRDLTQQIEDGDVVEPLVYMKFDPSSFVTNSGTGSNFTNQGTGVLPDSDFNL